MANPNLDIEVNAAAALYAIGPCFYFGRHPPFSYIVQTNANAQEKHQKGLFRKSDLSLSLFFSFYMCRLGTKH